MNTFCILQFHLYYCLVWFGICPVLCRCCIHSEDKWKLPLNLWHQRSHIEGWRGKGLCDVCIIILPVVLILDHLTCTFINALCLLINHASCRDVILFFTICFILDKLYWIVAPLWILMWDWGVSFILCGRVSSSASSRRLESGELPLVPRRPHSLISLLQFVNGTNLISKYISD